MLSARLRLEEKRSVGADVIRPPAIRRKTVRRGGCYPPVYDPKKTYRGIDKTVNKTRTKKTVRADGKLP